MAWDSDSPKKQSGTESREQWLVQADKVTRGLPEVSPGPPVMNTTMSS